MKNHWLFAVSTMLLGLQLRCGDDDSPGEMPRPDAGDTGGRASGGATATGGKVGTGGASAGGSDGGAGAPDASSGGDGGEGPGPEAGSGGTDGGGITCGASQQACSGSCVDTSADPAH